MRKFFRYFPEILFALLIILTGSSCYSDENASSNDVRFEVPSAITIQDGSESLSFRVLYKKNPSLSDKIVLGDPQYELHECEIIESNESSFTIRLYQGMTSGSYNVYYMPKGGKKQLIGTMNVTISYASEGDEITPDSGVTIYGQIKCGDSGVKDVTVSDGVEVVRTDEKGIYQIKSSKKYGYVFMSIPSGYEAASDGILPIIHQCLAKGASVAERVDFSLKEAGDQTQHTVFVLGDIHLAARTNDRSQFSDFVNDINEQIGNLNGAKAYGLTLGDMTWDLYWYSNNYMFPQYLADANAIRNLQIFHTIGNHDHDMNEAGDIKTIAKYSKYIAPTFYSFNIGKVHYVVLDDIECQNTGAGTSESRKYSTTLVEDQLSWLEKDLSYIPKTTPLVVAMHAPLYSAGGGNALKNATALENILKEYDKVHLFTGHTHIDYNVDKESSVNIFEHNSGAVCATWWWSGYLTPGVNVCTDGTPGGYAILKVDGEDFSWQYKATGRGAEYQFRTYDRNSMDLSGSKWVSSSTERQQKFTEYAESFAGTSSANEVYINIWNYDPKWTISVTENGNELKVSRVTGTRDPLHLIAYTAKRLEKTDNPTFPTTICPHMFKVTASSANSTLEIKVTDRFGNTYSETMNRPKQFDTDTYKY